MQNADDLNGCVSDSIEDGIRLRQHASEPRLDLVARPSKMRSVSKTRCGLIDFMEYLVGNFDRGDARKVSPNVAQILGRPRCQNERFTRSGHVRRGLA